MSETPLPEIPNNLAVVVAQVEEILVRADMCGVVLVVDKSGVASALRPESTWTAFKVTSAGITMADGGPADPQYRERLNRGIIALIQTQESLARMIDSIEELLDELQERYPWRQLIKLAERGPDLVPIPEAEAPRIITPGDPGFHQPPA